MKIVAEVGSPAYYSTRAIELIREAQDRMLEEGCQQFCDKLGQAISLLALAKAYVKKVR